MAYKVATSVPVWCKRESEKQYPDKTLASLMSKALKYCLDNGINLYEDKEEER